MASTKSPSARATTRKGRRERRAAKTLRRGKLLDVVISGYPYREIAKSFGISVATVRREVDRALAKQPPDSAERYIALQQARVQKALLYVDLRLEEGDLRAIPALVTLFAESDRYHGFAAAVRYNPPPRPLLQKEAPKALESPDRSMKLHAVDAEPDRREPALPPVVPGQQVNE
jgi:hypothetical protein